MTYAFDTAAHPTSTRPSMPEVREVVRVSLFAPVVVSALVVAALASITSLLAILLAIR